jgi:hypothetical protein
MATQRARKASTRRSARARAAANLPSVYISYSHEDQTFARTLSDELTQRGFHVWIDTLSLKPGDNLLEEINRGIKDSDIIVVVLSRAYARSTWVQQELSAFLVKESASAQNKIIPVLLQDCEIPITLRDRVWADFRGSFEEGLKQLLNGLQPKKTLARGSANLATASRETTDSSVEVQLDRIRREYHNGNLTLFCGAGVSVPAASPTGRSSWSPSSGR